MMHIVLYEPEIPQNTGNIVRTCKSTGSVLHLIEPLGFVIEDKKLKRAGLDYWYDMDIRIHENYSAFCEANPNARLWFVETHGNRPYHQVDFKDGDYFVFGKETTGIPLNICKQYSESCIHIPMVKNNRSLNLSNVVAIILYEALKMNGFMNFI